MPSTSSTPTEGAAPRRTPDSSGEMLANSHPVRRTRGLHYVIAAPGDTYTEIAREFDIPVKTLRKYNDATRNRIKDWEEVYLEEKHDNATDGPDSATIGDGESIHSPGPALRHETRRPTPSESRCPLTVRGAACVFAEKMLVSP